MACGEQGDLPAELLEGAGPGGLQLSLRQIQQADPAVLDTVHALGREVQKRHLPTVQEWQRVLSRVRSRRKSAGSCWWGGTESGSNGMGSGLPAQVQACLHWKLFWVLPRRCEAFRLVTNGQVRLSQSMPAQHSTGHVPALNLPASIPLPMPHWFMQVAKPAAGQERTRRERMLRTAVELRGTLMAAADRVGELDAAVATARELAAGEGPPAGLAAHDQQHPPTPQSQQLPTSSAAAGAAVGAAASTVAASTAQPVTQAGRRPGGPRNGGHGRTAEQQAMLDDLFGSDEDDEEAPLDEEPTARGGQSNSATRTAPAQVARQGSLSAARQKQARQEARAQQHRGSGQTRPVPVLDPAAPSRPMTFGLRPVARQARLAPDVGTAGPKLSSVLMPPAAQLAPCPTSAVTSTQHSQTGSGRSQDAAHSTSSAPQVSPQGPQGSSPPSAAQSAAASSAGVSRVAQSGHQPAMPSPASQPVPRPASKPGLSSKLAALAARKQAAQAKRAAEDEQKSAGSSGQAELAPEIKQALLAQVCVCVCAPRAWKLYPAAAAGCMRLESRHVCSTSAGRLGSCVRSSCGVASATVVQACRVHLPPVKPVDSEVSPALSQATVFKSAAGAC